MQPVGAYCRDRRRIAHTVPATARHAVCVGHSAQVISAHGLYSAQATPQAHSNRTASLGGWRERVCGNHVPLGECRSVGWVDEDLCAVNPPRACNPLMLLCRV